MPVVAAEVMVRDQPVYVEHIGQTRGSQDVEIRARVEGFLDSMNFVEGGAVKSNALLYTIDKRPFEAALAQAEGALAQAEAQWEKARRDTNRFGPLWERHAVSRQQYEDSLAAERAAAAVMSSAAAGVQTAKIQLGYTTIRSPIEGLAGKSEVPVGNLVGHGTSTLLTTISRLDPIDIRFSISEQDYLNFRLRFSDEEQARIAARELFELILADGTRHAYKGTVTYADRQVDPATGTLLLNVAFPNPQGLVRPGQFGRVRYPVMVVTNAVLVPQKAVEEVQATYSVYVVTADQKAELRKVEPGMRVGTFCMIYSGLRRGEKVVIEGGQKLQNNVPMAVTWTNLTLPPADAPAWGR